MSPFRHFTYMIVFVTSNNGKNIVCIDAFDTLQDAQAKLKAQQAKYPQDTGFSVHMVEQYASPTIP